jgi:hypothetical protein
VITIGAQFGGPELLDAPIRALILAATRAAQRACGDWVEGAVPAVNPVFYVPGTLDAYAELKQVEAARFSRKQKLLLVAIPVPQEVAAAGGSVDFIIDALRKANAIAAEVFASKGTENGPKRS